MNISNIQNCYGCGLCSVICAKHIIEIKLNAEGFYSNHSIFRLDTHVP